MHVVRGDQRLFVREKLTTDFADHTDWIRPKAALQIYLQGVIFHSAEGQRAATAKRVLLAYNAMPIEACAAS